jgi:hypothetical protein
MLHRCLIEQCIMSLIINDTLIRQFFFAAWEGYNLKLNNFLSSHPNVLILIRKIQKMNKLKNKLVH